MRSTSLALALALALIGAAPATGIAPLVSPATWINGSATAASLRGKVVIADVFTYSCINCKHVIPNLRTLYASLHAQGSRSSASIGQALVRTRPCKRGRDRQTQGIVWPVATTTTAGLGRLRHRVLAEPTGLRLARPPPQDHHRRRPRRRAQRYG